MAEAIDAERARANIQARIDAENLMSEFLEPEYSDKPERFWEVLYGLIERKLTPRTVVADKTVDRFDEREAIRFELQVMPNRGIHANREIGLVPCEYLVLWADGDDFTRLLRKYIRSERFKRRQQEEE